MQSFIAAGYSTDNSGNTALGSVKSLTVSGVSNSIPEHSHELSQSDSFRNSGHKSVWGGLNVLKTK